MCWRQHRTAGWTGNIGKLLSGKKMLDKNGKLGYNACTHI
jgi:hypothetical protein